MIPIMEMIIYYAMLLAGFALIMAGLLYVIWWAIGHVIKMLGYWDLFYRALMIAGREAYAAKKKKQ